MGHYALQWPAEKKRIGSTQAKRREAEAIAKKINLALAPNTIRNALSALRRFMNLAEREGLIDRNPAGRVGELIRRVARQSARETAEVEYWTRAEVATLISLAREHEPEFAPLLIFKLSTGTRRGEVLGLEWKDIDFDRRRISIRRSITKGKMTTPKNEERTGTGRQNVGWALRRAIRPPHFETP